MGITGDSALNCPISLDNRNHLVLLELSQLNSVALVEILNTLFSLMVALYKQGIPPLSSKCFALTPIYIRRHCSVLKSLQITTE